MTYNTHSDIGLNAVVGTEAFRTPIQKEGWSTFDADGCECCVSGCVCRIVALKLIHRLLFFLHSQTRFPEVIYIYICFLISVEPCMI